VLIHPWDAASDDDEWRAWLGTQQVGTLIAPGRGRAVPVVVPTHFIWDGSEVLLHLARPNPALRAVEEDPTVVFSVHGDWAYVPSAWKAVGAEDPTLGVPTSYYAAVTLVCEATVLEGEQLLEVLRAQLGAFEPGSAVADPVVHERRLPGIRGLRLAVRSAEAKFKYGGNVDAAHRSAVAAQLQARGDEGALAQLLRRTPLA
jgi:transcriptional regulator